MLRAAARLLVVDDEPRFLDLAERTLAGAGHDVAGACTSAEALSRLGSDRFDLVLVDRRLGDRNGVELIESARLVQATRFILWSSCLSEGDVEDADRLEVTAIGKLTGPPLVDFVEQLLAARARHRS